MTAISAKHYASSFCRRSTYHEFDIPRLGILNFDLFGRNPWKGFSADVYDGPRGTEAVLHFGPLHIEFAYLPETRAKRGTFTILALAALALAGWTEGHCWHLPSLG